jgi:PTS system glucitol/sorbitol-specific IIA component
MRPEPPEPGDILSIGENSFRITAVGDKAWQNIEELGHAIFVFNGFEEPEMPGQICLEEGGTANLTGSLQPGSRLEIKTGVEAAV